MEFEKMNTRAVNRLAICRNETGEKSILVEVKAYEFAAHDDSGNRFILAVHRYLGNDVKGWVVSDLDQSGLQITIKPQPTRTEAYDDFTSVKRAQFAKTALKCLAEMRNERNINHNLMTRYFDMVDDWKAGRE